MQAGVSIFLNGRINEAISELSTAASLDPKLTEAHNLLGVAYDKKGLARSRERFLRTRSERRTGRRPDVEQPRLLALSERKLSRRGRSPETCREAGSD